MQIKMVNIAVCVQDDGTQSIVYFHDTCTNLLDTIGVMQAGLRVLEAEFTKQQPTQEQHV